MNRLPADVLAGARRGPATQGLAHSRCGRQREVELAALTDPAVRDAVRAAGVELISFAALRP